MECLVVLVVVELRVRVVVDGLHLPLGVLECHFYIPLLFWIHLLLALLLAGRRAFFAQLLLFLAKLLRELLDLPTLTHAMAHRVMHRASGTTVINAECLTGALVTSWASAPS
jgi:uncharacterized membrane protein